MTPADREGPAPADRERPDAGEPEDRFGLDRWAATPDPPEPGRGPLAAGDTLDAPATGRKWIVIGGVLLGTCAAAQLAFGAAAIGGDGALEANVREIESDPNFGKLYLSLAGWGVLLALAGLFEAYAAQALLRRRPRGRLLGLCAALPGLVVAFFTLALFRVAALVTVLLLFAVLYVLSYRIEGWGSP